MADQATDNQRDYDVDKAVPLMEALREMGVAVVMITPHDVLSACDNKISYEEAEIRMWNHVGHIETVMDEAAQTYIDNEMTRID